jgi:hypothetical protein
VTRSQILLVQALKFILLPIHHADKRQLAPAFQSILASSFVTCRFHTSRGLSFRLVRPDLVQYISTNSTLHYHHNPKAGLLSTHIRKRGHQGSGIDKNFRSATTDSTTSLPGAENERTSRVMNWRRKSVLYCLKL